VSKPPGQLGARVISQRKKPFVHNLSACVAPWRFGGSLVAEAKAEFECAAGPRWTLHARVGKSGTGGLARLRLLYHLELCETNSQQSLRYAARPGASAPLLDFVRHAGWLQATGDVGMGQGTWKHQRIIDLLRDGGWRNREQYVEKAMERCKDRI